MRWDNVQLGKGGMKDTLTNGENEDNMYFMVEVDLLSNNFTFIGSIFEHIPNASVSIQNLEKPFRIGVSILSEAPNSIGLGLVKI